MSSHNISNDVSVILKCLSHSSSSKWFGIITCWNTITLPDIRADNMTVFIVSCWALSHIILVMSSTSNQLQICLFSYRMRKVIKVVLKSYIFLGNSFKRLHLNSSPQNDSLKIFTNSQDFCTFWQNNWRCFNQIFCPPIENLFTQNAFDILWHFKLFKIR